MTPDAELAHLERLATCHRNRLAYLRALDGDSANFAERYAQGYSMSFPRPDDSTPYDAQIRWLRAKIARRDRLQAI